MVSRRCVESALVLSLAACPSLFALRFQEIAADQGKRVLFIRDCALGNIPNEKPCAGYENGFEGPSDESGYRGDSAVLGQILSRSRFEEVWLFSGGGNLDEGIKVGRLLRRHSATVRVPNVARVRSIIAWPKPTMQVFCVSSCTVAFMGGLFRYVDPDATYQVHSASSVTQLSKELSTFLDDNGFAGFAASKERSTRLNGIRLFRHFQNTLVMPLVRPGGIQPFAENDQSFLDWAKRFRSRYSAAQFEVDRQRYESEGRASLQDILMRIERDSMMGVIEDIRADLNSYGSRAKHALAMLEVMYKVGIKDTFILDRETMYAMGYLTKDLPTAP